MLIEKIAAKLHKIVTEHALTAQPDAIAFQPQYGKWAEIAPELQRMRWLTVDRVLRAAASLVEDDADLTAGTTAMALVEELSRKLGGDVPTRRQVEELALAHMAVAAELARVADTWEGDDCRDGFRVVQEEETTSVIPGHVQRELVAACAEAEREDDPMAPPDTAIAPMPRHCRVCTCVMPQIEFENWIQVPPPFFINLETQEVICAHCRIDSPP